MVYNDFHFLKPITANAWLKSVGVPQGIYDFLALVCALNGNIAQEIECSKGIAVGKRMATYGCYASFL